MSVMADRVPGGTHASICITVEVAPTRQRCSNAVEPFDSDLLGFAQIGFAELALLLAVHIPVPTMTLAFPSNGEGAQMVFESKGLVLLSRQPAVPVLGANKDGVRWLLEQA